MKLRRKTLVVLAVLAGLALALAVPVLVLLNRPPVLIVADFSFISLYGPLRVRLETVRSSAVLFQPVKPVVIADDAGDDIIQFAVASASPRPFCVIFPLRFAMAAKLYREQNPEIPVVLLEGRYPAEGVNPASFAINSNDTSDYYIYTTDIQADYYRAGLAAAILDGEKNGRTVVFLDNRIQRQAREAFLESLKDQEKTMNTLFYTSISQLSNVSDLSCVVLAGSGVDYLDRNAEIPVIFFTWLNPALLSNEIILVFDDSPWAQAVPAARMVAAQVMTGQIPSKILILPSENIDKDVYQKLKKTTGAEYWPSIFNKE